MTSIDGKVPTMDQIVDSNKFIRLTMNRTDPPNDGYWMLRAISNTCLSGKTLVRCFRHEDLITFRMSDFDLLAVDFSGALIIVTSSAVGRSQ